MGLDKYQTLQMKLLQPNAQSIGVVKLIDKYYPSFAKKILERNPLMQALVSNNLCTMHILHYPICGSCETLALWNGYVENQDGTLGKTCKCWKCGVTTNNPIRLRDFCLTELKKKAPENIGDSLDIAIDIIAQRSIADADRIYRKSLKEN